MGAQLERSDVPTQGMWSVLRARGCRSFVFLAGDSTLDNHDAAWVGDHVAQAVNGYEVGPAVGSHPPALFLAQKT
eukprot:1664681-Amphidinium_carterae.2